MAVNGSALQRLREQEREARRNLILDAAVGLFARRPYQQVGMRDIAAEADMSAASLYRYFTDRDQLFVEALYRESEAISQGLRQLLARGEGAHLENLAAGFVDHLLDHDTFFQMMAHFMVDGGMSDEAVERFNLTERRMLDVFEEVFRDLGAPGNLRLLAHAFFASLSGILITFRNYPGRRPEETRRHMTRLARLLAQVFRQGTLVQGTLAPAEPAPAKPARRRGRAKTDPS
jgi:AcrR family transcriptional regulator